MDAFKNCPRCGKLFKSYGNTVCQECIATEESDFKLVKEYIYDHENANIIEISEETGVSAEKIIRFLKEERLLMTSNDCNAALVCESCGSPIQTGRYCSGCKKELEASFKRELGNAAQNAERRDSSNREKDRMFTASRRK